MMLLLLAQLLFTARPCPTPAQAPRVVLIIADDLGWPEVPLMPALAALAKAGTTFTRAYSWPTCSPSRLAMLTGRYPRTVQTYNASLVAQPDGVGDLPFNAFSSAGERLHPSLSMLPDAFEHAALIGKWHLGRTAFVGDMDQIPSGPYCQGFELWRAGSPVVIATGPGASGYYDWNRVADGGIFPEADYATDVQRDAFLALARPALTVLAWSAPHSPFDTPPGMTDGATTRDDYENVVEYLDDALADVLASIDLGEDYVIFVSDNGTPDDARPTGAPSGYWKGSLYEGGIRVPLIVAGPGVAAGVETDRLISLVDIPATIAELMGVAFATPDGVSFADELGAWAGETARAFAFSERYEVVASAAYPQPAGYDGVAIVEDETTLSGTTVRLKRIIEDADGSGPGGFTDQVYNLVADPYELNPFPFSGLPASVRARLDAELASTPARADP